MGEALFRPDSTLNGVDAVSTVVCNPDTMEFPLGFQPANGRWSFAKGGLDVADINAANNGPMSVDMYAAYREIYEEIGLEQSDIHAMLPLGDAIRLSEGRGVFQRVRFRLALTDSSLEGLTPNAQDVSEVGVFDADGVLDRLHNPTDKEVFQVALARIAMGSVQHGGEDAS